MRATEIVQFGGSFVKRRDAREGPQIRRNLAVVHRIGCSRCGAGIDQPCRDLKTGQPFTVNFLHTSRFIDARRGVLSAPRVDPVLPASDIATSPVVGSLRQLSPVNRQTLQVVTPDPQWRGVYANEARLPACPLLRTIPLDPMLPNFVGLKYGRMVVVGLSAHRIGTEGRGGNKRGAWVCRCSCGYFVFRSTRAIRLALDPDACCGVCNHIAHEEHIRQYLLAHGGI